MYYVAKLLRVKLSERLYFENFEKSQSPEVGSLPCTKILVQIYTDQVKARIYNDCFANWLPLKPFKGFDSSTFRSILSKCAERNS